MWTVWKEENNCTFDNVELFLIIFLSCNKLNFNIKSHIIMGSNDLD
jgi:hypothetical protein